MTETRTGGCLCKAVRYELTVAPIATVVCNCTNCQHSSGSALSTIALVPRAGLAVTGELKGYEYAGDSGGKLEINFCPHCGSHFEDPSCPNLDCEAIPAEGAAFCDHCGTDLKAEA